MFIWDKGALNKEQEDAIYENESTLLIACPGSGKTRTLTYKIAYELSRIKSKKEYIIAITYTNAAAEEIRERVEILGVDTNQLFIGTIHSFCLEWILKPYYLYSEELKNGFEIINSHDSETIITELCKKYKGKDITYWDWHYYAAIDGYKLSCLDPEKLIYLEEILKDYHKILLEEKQIDFEQILFYSYKLISQKGKISTILSNLFPFVLVDEFQDTKEIQYHIIATILKIGIGKTKTLIVGDPNQSIYETLGGFPMSKKDMERLFGFKLAELHLSGNYRSSCRIIDYFDNYKTYPNTIIPCGKDVEYESIITYNKSIDKSQLVDEIVKLIRFSVIDKQIPQHEICIAAPQWVQLAVLTRSLIVKLPDYSFDGPGMAPFSRDVDNFWFKVSRILLTEPSPDLYIRRLRWAKEIIDELSFVGLDVTTLTNKLLLKLCNSINIPESDGLKYLKQAFIQLMLNIGVSLSTYPTLTQHYNSFFLSSEARIEKLKKEGNIYIGSIDNFKKVFKQREGIKISTIHGVKGTEFDTVIGFGLLDSWLPHFKDDNGHINSKKMIYVLSSRARKNLHLISEKGRNINKYNPIGLQPTPILEAYNFQYDI